ncbi:MAG: hypothetical protein MRK01_07615 [Candidatus Scalindua sp.]|nr:hypothetical protein [Candidatus Scalindua sp.]
MKSILLSIALFLVPVLSGCFFTAGDQVRKDISNSSSSSKYLRTFQVDYETLWSAAVIALDGMPLEKIDKDKGLIKSGWLEGWSQKNARSVLTRKFLDDNWQERHCLIVNVSRNNTFCTVAVSCRVQEKPRGGSAAYRWQRVHSTGEKEEEFLTHVEDIIGLP